MIELTIFFTKQISGGQSAIDPNDLLFRVGKYLYPNPGFSEACVKANISPNRDGFIIDIVDRSACTETDFALVERVKENAKASGRPTCLRY